MNKVTRVAKFSASHRLFNPSFSDEKNNEIFGLCNNPHGHGHNYTLEVTIHGTPDKETGYIIDLKRLKELINTLIIFPCDHKHLNHQVPFLKEINPTVENLAECFFLRLQPEIEKITHGSLYSVKVSETDNNWAEYCHE
ncbi:MAG: hypothetical protein S4CHLAM45_07820 [Chlamydiales bacterium]|nr:hypothetical protein [Chlamydiales bacterium]MCH9620008.1 hypothetical protein [Chlamydiales bacterium]MCH9622888.1 hypothetical protein [Chlamydiales bacterium]